MHHSQVMTYHSHTVTYHSQVMPSGVDSTSERIDSAETLMIATYVVWSKSIDSDVCTIFPYFAPIPAPPTLSSLPFPLTHIHNSPSHNCQIHKFGNKSSKGRQTRSYRAGSEWNCCTPSNNHIVYVWRNRILPLPQMLVLKRAEYASLLFYKYYLNTVLTLAASACFSQCYQWMGVRLFLFDWANQWYANEKLHDYRKMFHFLPMAHVRDVISWRWNFMTRMTKP